MSTGQDVPKRGMSPLLIVAIVVGCLAVGLLCLAALLWPAIRAAREAARVNSCSNQMKLISLALLNYESTYHTFPPAYIADAAGKPMHSWRVLILPFLEQDDLYKAYNFNEPWDGPNNSKLASRMPPEYGCPSDPHGGNTTSYLAVVGVETVWPGRLGMKARSIRDGPGQTILIVEASKAGINWMEPRDLSYESARQGINRSGTADCLASDHVAPPIVAYCDGTVQRLYPDDVPPELLAALLTANGRENVRKPDF